MVVHQFSKLATRVRFPSPAPLLGAHRSSVPINDRNTAASHSSVAYHHPPTADRWADRNNFDILHYMKVQAVFGRLQDGLGSSLRPLLRRRELVLILSASLILEVLIWVIWKVKVEAPKLPVYIPTLLAPPKYTLLILILNSLLTFEAIRHERLYAYLLLGTALFIQLLALFLIWSYLKGGGAALLI